MEEFELLKSKFSAVYAGNKWGNGSGPGSAPKNTISYRLCLENFIKDNAIATVTDLGCGDWQFSRYIDWGKVNYVGFDVVH